MKENWEDHQENCESEKSHGQIENYIKMEFQRILETNVKPDIALKRINLRIFQLITKNNVAISIINKGPLSIEGSFAEKTYLKLLGKKSKSTDTKMLGIWVYFRRGKKKIFLFKSGPRKI